MIVPPSLWRRDLSENRADQGPEAPKAVHLAVRHLGITNNERKRGAGCPTTERG